MCDSDRRIGLVDMLTPCPTAPVGVNVGAVMDGDIDYFINEKLKQRDED